MPSLRQKANNNQTRCEDSDEKKKNAQGRGVTISTARSEPAHSEKEEGEGRYCRCLGLITCSMMQEDDLVLAGMRVELRMERGMAVR